MKKCTAEPRERKPGRAQLSIVVALGVALLGSVVLAQSGAQKPSTSPVSQALSQEMTRAFELLRVLLEANGSLVSKEQLLAQVGPAASSQRIT